MKQGGKRRNAGRKPSWNSTDKSTTIRVPESLEQSLRLAKIVKVDVEQLINVIDDLSNNVSMKLSQNQCN